MIRKMKWKATNTIGVSKADIIAMATASDTRHYLRHEHGLHIRALSHYNAHGLSRGSILQFRPLGLVWLSNFRGRSRVADLSRSHRRLASGGVKHNGARVGGHADTHVGKCLMVRSGQAAQELVPGFNTTEHILCLELIHSVDLVQ